MDFKDIMLEHSFVIKEAHTKVYHDEDDNKTDEKIVFVVFEEKIEYDGLSSDYAVMSRAVARKLKSYNNDAEITSFLEQLNFSRQDDQFAITFANKTLFQWSKKTEQETTNGFVNTIDKVDSAMKKEFDSLKKIRDDNKGDKKILFAVIDKTKELYALSVEPFYISNFNTSQNLFGPYKSISVLNDKRKWYVDVDYIDIFSLNIFDSIDYFVENYDEVYRCRKRAIWIIKKLPDFIEKALWRSRRTGEIPEIIVDVPLGVITLNSNYESDTPDEGIWRISEDEYDSIISNLEWRETMAMDYELNYTLDYEVLVSMVESVVSEYNDVNLFLDTTIVNKFLDWEMGKRIEMDEMDKMRHW